MKNIRLIPIQKHQCFKERRKTTMANRLGCDLKQSDPYKDAGNARLTGLWKKYFRGAPRALILDGYFPRTCLHFAESEVTSVNTCPQCVDHHLQAGADHAFVCDMADYIRDEGAPHDIIYHDGNSCIPKTAEHLRGYFEKNMVGGILSVCYSTRRTSKKILNRRLGDIGLPSVEHPREYLDAREQDVILADMVRHLARLHGRVILHYQINPLRARSVSTHTVVLM